MNFIAETILWPPRSAIPPLAGNKVHLWAAPLSISADTSENLALTLSSEEKERAARFKFEKGRNRFVAGRGILRQILESYTQTNAADLRIDYSKNGKPTLVQQRAGPPVHFNLAHSEDLALIAVTRTGAVGVDVEHVRRINDMDALVARFFSRRENELFQKLGPDQKPLAFFNLWTRKEALLKATGEGITRSLSLIEVSFLPDEPVRLQAISGDSTNAAQWTLQEISPAAGFVGAIAIHAKEIEMHCAKWEPDA